MNTIYTVDAGFFETVGPRRGGAGVERADFESAKAKQLKAHGGADQTQTTSNSYDFAFYSSVSLFMDLHF